MDSFLNLKSLKSSPLSLRRVATESGWANPNRRAALHNLHSYFCSMETVKTSS